MKITREDLIRIIKEELEVVNNLQEQEADEATVEKAMKLKDEPKVQAIYDILDDNPEVQAALQQFMAAELNEQSLLQTAKLYNAEEYDKLYNKLVDSLIGQPVFGMTAVSGRSSEGTYETAEDVQAFLDYTKVLRPPEAAKKAPHIQDSAARHLKKVAVGMGVIARPKKPETPSGDFRAGTMMGATVGAGATAMAAAGKLTATAAGAKLLAALGAAGLTVGGATMAATLGAVFLPIAIGYAIDKATK